MSLTETKSPEISVLFMQISAPDQIGSLKNVGKLALGVGGASYVVAAPAAVGAAKLAGAHPWITAIAMVVGVGYQQLNTKWQRDVTAGYCGDISTGTEARSGCSAVRVVNYDVNNIKQFCSVIESIS